MIEYFARNRNLDNTQLHRGNALFLPYSACGSQSRKLGAGKSPGQSSRLCDCGKFIKWIGAKEASTIASHKGEV